MAGEGQLYYIQDSRSYVGNSVLWWRENGEGYTTDLRDAGKYDADYLRRLRLSDIPWECEKVDAVATLQVDMQRLRETKKGK